MNAFLNPRNGASLTNIIDVTAHSTSLFQENEQPKYITETYSTNKYFNSRTYRCSN